MKDKCELKALPNYSASTFHRQLLDIGFHRFVYISLFFVCQQHFSMSSSFSASTKIYSSSLLVWVLFIQTYFLCGFSTLMLVFLILSLSRLQPKKFLAIFLLTFVVSCLFCIFLVRGESTNCRILSALRLSL